MTPPTIEAGTRASASGPPYPATQASPPHLGFYTYF